MIEKHAVPEQGQVITVRQRRFVVSDVIEHSLVLDPLRETPGKSQLLVYLTSIEDDALGETLQVVWELEPGAKINEVIGLPQPIGFDSPYRYDAFINAVRWGAISSADARILQSPFRSGIEIEDYQLDPLVRAIQMPRVSLLIADDVGLGKTIEAGLVMQELIVRNRARTVLIVCPAGLQIHWRDQMRDKFGLEFRIVDSDQMRNLRRDRGIHANPWSHFPRLITSIDFLKRERPTRLLREVLPSEGESTYPRRYDILIVDEAHNVAPAGRGRDVSDSLRTAAIRTIAPHFEHKLFLSATPHNGYQENFTALLELLDDQRFARGVMPDRRQLDAVMVRRLKSELVNPWDGRPRFPERKLDVIEVEYTDDERQAHRWLRSYTTLRQQNARDASEEFATEFVLKLLKKRLFSSPAAFAATLVQHEKTLSQIDDVDDRARSGKRPMVGILRRQIAQMDEDYADDDEYENTTHGTVDAASKLFHGLTHEEYQLLTAMREWAERAEGRPDSKALALIEWLQGIVKPYGEWSDERVIIFTEYRATQNWLQGVLVSAGLASQDRLMTLYGGMDPDERERIKAAFQASPDQSSVRILLATDAASEGIDLQNHCYRLIHYEIPWNPNRMEQRNGRIDRHGQKHDPLIYHFAGQGYRTRSVEALALEPGDLEGDLEFLMHAARKVEQIREDLGNVGPVIAAQVEEAMLGRRRQLDTLQTEDKTASVRRMLKFERDLRKQIEAHYQQLQDTQQQLELSPDNILTAVEVALELAGQPSLIPTDDPDIFHVPALRGSWASCSEGLEHPHTREVRPITFSHRVAQGRDDVVLAHLNHRLVQMALRLLRAEVWSLEERKGLYRVTVRCVPNHALDTMAVIAHARLVVIGGDSHRLHEEIVTAGGTLRNRRFQRMNVGETQAALDTMLDTPANERVQADIADLWPEIEDNLKLALEARMRDYLNRMERLLQEREAKELADIEAILTELQNAIERELGEPEIRQLSFWEVDNDQLYRNKTALRARLDQIPGEIEAEQAQIRKRFENPQPRLFPVGVTFLVPERFNR